MSNQTNQPIPNITVLELAARLQSDTADLQLVDVREPAEIAAASIEGFENFPLSEFAEWSELIHSRLDLEAETLVLCHHGMRSAHMCQWLRDRGVTKVKNISGGIDAYSQLVDPSVPRY